ncbi:MAG TPA: lytic transglycosylase domain-containing protein [Pyrinomonadaceae bacterium]|nr:lytic transglycosylase domain-containing protein [Pyrinomonadaceae bacterium]
MCGQWKQITCAVVLCLLSALSILAQDKTTNTEKKIVGYTVTLTDGYSFDVDEVNKQGAETWVRKGNIQRQIQEPIKSIKPIFQPVKVDAAAADTTKPAPTATATVNTTTTTPTKPTGPNPIWIYLVDGAKFRVDQVQEQADGAWYSRQNVSIFLAKERISRIEYEAPDAPAARTKNADWTSGSTAIDQLIRTNANRFGIDPYLVFLIIEKESRFHTRAVSPKGAMGLMQLMPGTARRLGVRKPFDAAENIRGGTQYMRELMDMFGGKVDLVLASYNAGEGAVLKYGRNVPPYRETRDYVKTIGKRYGLTGRQPGSQTEVPEPQR